MPNPTGWVDPLGLVSAQKNTPENDVGEQSSSVWHATTNSRATEGVLGGIDPAFLNPNSRFGPAFYVAENPSTTLAELSHHGVVASHGIRFEVNREAMKVLDLTDPKVAKKWGTMVAPLAQERNRLEKGRRVLVLTLFVSTRSAMRKESTMLYWTTSM